MVGLNNYLLNEDWANLTENNSHMFSGQGETSSPAMYTVQRQSFDSNEMISGQSCIKFNEHYSSDVNEPSGSNSRLQTSPTSISNKHGTIEWRNDQDRVEYPHDNTVSEKTGDLGTNTENQYINVDLQRSKECLTERLSSHATLKQLEKLRKVHCLSSYSRNKADIFKALQDHSCDRQCLTNQGISLGKRRRKDNADWPVLISDDERRNIIKDFIDRTDQKTLKFDECSFCGVQASSSDLKEYKTEGLDISLLLEKKKYLQERFCTEHLEIHKANGDKYLVCNNCDRCIKKKKFQKIPLYSYANGCWIGDVPAELQDLTLLEELCLARVRSTRCSIKLSTGKFSQYASQGKVCIFPQEPKNLMKVLPPPLHTMYDEVAVIFVNNKDSKVTEQILRRAPLLIRRSKIRDALTWLKSNNRLYNDIVISSDNLNEYSEDGSLIDLPAQFIMHSESEGSGYTPQENTTTSQTSVGGPTVLQSCGVLDSDQQERSQSLRKLEMVEELLRRKRPYVKFPNSSSEPVPTYKNSKLYALLWPSLFPYGIGTFEDEVRNLNTKGFRKIETKRHVKHLLNLTDKRFQTHTTFPFIMMNLMQRRVTSFQSKLMAKRTCFPKIVKAFKNLDPDALTSVKEKMINKIRLGESEPEKAVSTLLKYVNIISEDVCGSIGEVKRMKAEIRSIIRTKGLPHMFVTINPADTMNPITQVFAGRDIDLDKIFDDASFGKEDFERFKAATQNPAAAAKAFDIVIKSFVDVLLGKDRINECGVFGPLESYYGVVEAQGRGSLHCHFFVWLKNGLDPFEIRDKLKANENWRTHFFSWLEAAIKQDLPENTTKDDLKRQNLKKEPLMSRPDRPDKFTSKKSFKNHFNQDVRNLLHLTGQIHEHSFTCFKHLTTVTANHKFGDDDCRFGLPRDTVPSTYIDDDGHIHLVCHDGSVNGYHDIIVYCLRCNMDCKFIGSGTAAYAMTEYVTNYMAKISLDSSVIFSCLCAALAAVRKNVENQPNDSTSSEDQARLLLLKICNGMIGKRELSGQQVMSYLLNIPNRYTDHHFETIWWSSLLKFISKKHFCLETEEENDFVMINDTNIDIDCDTEKNLPKLVADYLYRPFELQHVCLWDFWCEYKTVKRRRSEDDEDDDVEKECQPKTYQFSVRHPKHHQQILRPRRFKITPVITGIQIPRCDRDNDDKEKFEVIALTLFKPWRETESILRDVDESWQEAFNNMVTGLNSNHKSILKNFQAVHSCKDAADDFSKKRLKNNAGQYLFVQKGAESQTDEIVQDEEWENAMKSDWNDEVEINNDTDGIEEYFGTMGQSNIIDALSSASDAGFYEISLNNRNDGNCREYDFVEAIREGTSVDITDAQKEYENVLKGDRKESNESILNKYNWTLEQNTGEPGQEIFQVDESEPSNINATNLHPHRLLCMKIIQRLTLNEEQSLAFLLFADRYGLRHCTLQNRDDSHRPIRLIISGPGGTGKSQIFQAISVFLHVLGHGKQIKMTAPTGLAANNINGSTVHSEVNLRIAPREMLRNDARGVKRREQLEKKYQNIKSQVIDEIYFMSARDNALLSQYLKLTNQSSPDEAYGGLNMIFAGDPAQLPPPKQMSLFDHRLVQKVNDNLNATNENAMTNLSGVVIWQQIQDCVVLRQIMRQKDKYFQDILNRLRFGICTPEDFEGLQNFVAENRTLQENKELLDISLWLTNPDNASPLITYTNAIRDAHNVRCAEAFALDTGQEYHEYHSVDTVNRGKTVLTNLAAKAAWNTAVKKAHDLAGKLPLIPYMPIFLTQNLATHLGLSNGGFGRLISAKYIVDNGVRYAISAIIEINQYNGGPQNHPHRLTIVPVKTQVTYNLPGRDKNYTATRSQLPIIPAFAFTAHNSQSRSLNRACIDLESCPSTASAYVMLSRLRSLSGLTILRPFSYKKISRHCPQETRNEIARLEELHEATVQRSKRDLKWYYDLIEGETRVT